MRIPLFPLPLVLFPDMPLPLHIFEPRYRAMVDRCIKENLNFGILLTEHGKLRGFGTSARIENILHKFDDGRMDILCLGKERFHVEELFEDKDYLEGLVTYFDDETEPPEDLEELRIEAKTLLDEYTCISGKRCNSFFFDQLTPASYSFFLAELNSYTLTQQQNLLETRSARQRLFKVIAGLKALIERTQTDLRLKEILGETEDFSNICN